jgi:hypothetical protein
MLYEVTDVWMVMRLSSLSSCFFSFLSSSHGILHHVIFVIIIIIMWSPSLHDFSLYMINIPVWSLSSSLYDQHPRVIMIIINWSSSEWFSSLHDYHLNVIIIIISTWSASPCDHDYHQMIITSEWSSSLCDHDCHHVTIIMAIILTWLPS